MQRRPHRRLLFLLPCLLLLLSPQSSALQKFSSSRRAFPSHIEIDAVRRSTGLGLRLRGGSEDPGYAQPSGFGQAPGGYGQPPAAPYGQPRAPSPSIPQYSSPAAAPVDWGSPPQAPPPAPPADFAPPAPAPRAPPRAPAPAPMPAAPPPLPPKAPAPAAPPSAAPTGGEVAWDQSSASPVRRFIDLFGWDNVSPFVWFALSYFLVWVNAFFCRSADDDDIDMTPGRK